MMKKFSLLLLAILLLSSCLNNDNDVANFSYEYVAIDEAITPASFTFGEKDSITVKYSLPNSCYFFDRMYYEYKDSTRIVAVIAYVDLNKACAEVFVQEEHKFAVTATQREDYIFKFYKGRDTNGDSIFDEVVVPVN